MTDQETAVRAAPFMSPMQQYGTSIQQLTDPSEELFQIELTFRSQIIDKDGNIKQNGDPLMNEKGIMSVMGQIKSIVHRISFFNSFNDKDIPILIDFLGDTLSKDLMMNAKEYEIKSVSSKDKIYFTALSMTYITIKRALNNGERGFWKGSQQDIRQFIETGNKSGGLFSMFGWGKKQGSGS